MRNITILNSDFAKELELQLAPAIKAGFPSPADDYRHDRLDFNRDLIRHPEATFYGRVDGDSMRDVGICDGDIAVIDRNSKRLLELVNQLLDFRKMESRTTD